jgi:hypothetical protein
MTLGYAIYLAVLASALGALIVAIHATKRRHRLVVAATAVEGK